MVECTVTLENGISSGCSFFVRVIDNEDPTIQCPANQIILSENGDPVTVNTDGPTYDDNSGAERNKAECTFGINIVAAASSDPCEGDTNQCNGRGVCLTTSTASKQYTCSCFEGWTGQFCQDTDYQDPCEGPGADGDYNWQCNQKGTCITTDITLGEYTCECYDGWIGDRCEESENENSESTTAVAGDGNGGDGNGDIDRENSAQSGLNTAIVAGGASGGLLIVIIILVAIIACFVVKGRRSKPSERTLSTHPLAASNGSQPENGKSPSVKKDGLENPSYSSHIDSRYSHALPTISQPTAPPNMPPPAYTPMAATTGKKIPPRLPSTNPSALYQGGSVMYSRGGSVATYGGYERPDINGGNQPNQSYDNTLYETNVYEELDEVTLNPPQYEEPEYMDVEG
ncbi:uncharacterized protein [Amphiura filiformis]|uniref:uncharacterized protein n=1 Tax=Amphiura filiformis TaxID=82378 RepID=UPI003B210020